MTQGRFNFINFLIGLSILGPLYAGSYHILTAEQYAPHIPKIFQITKEPLILKLILTTLIPILAFLALVIGGMIIAFIYCGLAAFGEEVVNFLSKVKDKFGAL